MEYSYDTASRLLSLDNSTGSGHYVYEYAYDKVGNRTSMAVTDSGGTKMHLYAYDKTYQVTEVNYPVGYEYLATDTTFHYDGVGNRTSVIDTGGTTNYTTNALNQYTAVGGVTCLYDASGNMTCDGANIYEYDPENRLTKVTEGADAFAAACDIDLKFTTGGDAAWFCQNDEYSTDHDAARSGDIGDNQETWLQTTVTGPGSLRFDFKLSCDPSNDGLGLYVDGLALGFWTASGVWSDPGPFSISGSGTHTIRWKYIKGGSSSAGSDCLWIDNVRWTGAMPDVNEIEYVYDPSGRRIEKKVDGTTELKFLYDGDHIIAEYDANDTLLRKYVHGPCIDEPICLIESSGTYAGTQYYHYDALGSVVALTDSNGDVVQLYEYSVYGQVAASDANHPNRFMFTGREFDKDTGLYYYRARYYHPEIGRFLQTDPIGYGDGMNLYTYCGNSPTNHVDPSGNSYFLMRELLVGEGDGPGINIRVTIYDDMSNELRHADVCGVSGACAWLCDQDDVFADDWLKKQEGWKLSGGDELTFWHLQAIDQLGGGFDYKALEDWGVTIVRIGFTEDPAYNQWSKKVRWGGPTWIKNQTPIIDLTKSGRDRDVVILAHELQHAKDHYNGARIWCTGDREYSLKNAIRTENLVMKACIGMAERAYRIGEPTGGYPHEGVFTVEDYMRPGGYSTDEPPPAPPWPARRHRR